MFQIRLHGRGGQGVVTASDMIALAGFMEGHFAQAFPSFGSERTGAPVVAFARLDNKQIRLREPVMEPDVVLVQDSSLLESVDVFAGLRPDGYVVINSPRTPQELGIQELVERFPKGHIISAPVSQFAIEKIGRNVPGAGMLAAMAAQTGMMKLESVINAFNEKFKGKVAQSNAEVAQLTFEHVTALLKEINNA